MGESFESLHRRGMISDKAAGKAGLFKGKNATKTNQGDGDPDFEEKDGVRDQGGIRDRGHPAAGRDHIERKAGQRKMRRKDNGLGGPVDGNLDNARGHPGRNELDEAEHQKPDFPREGTRVKKSEASRRVGRDAPGTPSGPEYGGPNSRKYG